MTQFAQGGLVVQAGLVVKDAGQDCSLAGESGRNSTYFLEMPCGSFASLPASHNKATTSDLVSAGKTQEA